MTDLQNQLLDLQTRFDQIKVKLDPDRRQKTIRDLAARTMHADFWADRDEAQSVMKRLAALQQEQQSLSELESE